MIIKDYKYITHKLIQRLWGAECRFTVAKLDDSHINDVISVPDLKIDEKELSELILQRLKIIDHPIEPFIDPQIKMVEDAAFAKEGEIKAILIKKGILLAGQSIEDITARSVE